MPICATCKNFIPDLAAHTCPLAAGGVSALDRLKAAYTVDGLTNIPSNSHQRDTIADALCVPATSAILSPLVGGDVAKMSKLLKVVNQDTGRRVSHLVQVNKMLPPSQKILALLPKKSVAIDHGLVMALQGLSASEKAGMSDFFTAAPAGRAMVNLRGYVQSPGYAFQDNELRKALRVVSMIGAKKQDALSRDLMQVWMTAFGAHGPASNTMPDCAMTPAVLKQHFEKHCCNLHGNTHGEEPFWWANTLRYSISKADLVAAGIVLSSTEESRVFPYGDTITSANCSKHLFETHACQGLADRLYGMHGTKYHAHIQSEFKKASKAFVSFHGKVQIAARKGLFFFMASYESGVLQLKSSYSPDNLDAHWTANQADRIWDIRV